MRFQIQCNCTECTYMTVKIAAMVVIDTLLYKWEVVSIVVLAAAAAIMDARLRPSFNHDDNWC